MDIKARVHRLIETTSSLPHKAGWYALLLFHRKFFDLYGKSVPPGAGAADSRLS